MQIDVLPIKHQAHPAALRRGATGSLQQSSVNPQYSLAFKSYHNLATMLSEILRLYISPYAIVRLEGVN